MSGLVRSSDRPAVESVVEYIDAEQEVGGATSEAIIGEKRGRLSGDDGDEMMIQDDVTGEHGRNVRN